MIGKPEQQRQHQSSADGALSAGVAFGFLGMLGFSGTLVATRAAVADFSPLSITCARIVIAGVLGAVYLSAVRGWTLPRRDLLPSLLVMGLGLAVGYPFFIALALESVPSVHGAVVAGLTPAATAIISVVRTGERPPVAFWIACATGFAGVFYYAYRTGGGQLSVADGWLVLAMLSLGIAYVEGGRVAAVLGGSVTLSWAMLLLAPASAMLLGWSLGGVDLATAAPSSLVAVAYLGVVSMFLAAIFWYRGLSAGGIARIGQINLLLPLAALAWAALFLGEPVPPLAIVCAIVVFAAMLVCLRSRISR